MEALTRGRVRVVNGRAGGLFFGQGGRHVGHNARHENAGSVRERSEALVSHHWRHGKF